MNRSVHQLLHIVTLSVLIIKVIAEQGQDSNHTDLFAIESNYTFPYSVIKGKPRILDFNYSFLSPNGTSLSTPSTGWVIETSLDNTKTISIHGESAFYIEKTHPVGMLSVSLEAELPGRNTLIFHGKSWANSSQETDQNTEDYGTLKFKLYSEREERPLDIAFNVVVVLLVVCANVGMGAKTELAVIKKELKRPVAPIIGLCSQFIIMPLVSFAIAYNVDLDPGVALGFFAMGCAPGGSASNLYAFLLEANVSLSVTMTLISTIAALGLMPMWLFTLGKVVYDEGNLHIPFENIFFSLLGIIIPVGIGFLLQKKFPKAAAFAIKAVKYITVVFVVFVFTVGVYANYYVFLLMSGEVLLGAAMLPYIGFILGGLVALIFRQDKANIVTIAVETGIQNTGIPIVMLRLSLLGPDKDTGIVAPVASAILTPIPLLFGVAYVQGRKYLQARRQKQELPEGGCIYTDGKNASNKNTNGGGDYKLVLTKDDDDVDEDGIDN